MTTVRKQTATLDKPAHLDGEKKENRAQFIRTTPHKLKALKLECKTNLGYSIVVALLLVEGLLFRFTVVYT